MNFKLPKIYPLTDVSLTKFSHLEQVERLAAGGATIIQLREKYASSKDFYESAKAVVEFAGSKKIKIIINDRVDIALAVKACGVHLGQDDLPPSSARKILGASAIIGFSTHTLRQVAEAVKFPVDYIAFGPIFPTSSKENSDTVVGLEALKKVRETIGDFPLAAIGGINFENAAEVFRNGADSLAVISAILNPVSRISDNLKRLDQIIR